MNCKHEWQVATWGNISAEVRCKHCGKRSTAPVEWESDNDEGVATRIARIDLMEVSQ